MKTIEEMAREAGDDWDSTLSTDKEFLKRFAALVRADERESCANVCDDLAEVCEYEREFIRAAQAEDCADAIRARGQA
jgi:hypothetical protein